MTSATERLRGLLAKATPGPWMVQDGCSWRRIGTHFHDGDVLCPTRQTDGCLDLTADNGKRDDNLRLIVAAVNQLPGLLDRIEELERENAKLSADDWVGDPGRFAEWPADTMAAQCRMQARDNIDPEYSQFMAAVASRLTSPQHGRPMADAPRQAEAADVKSDTETYELGKRDGFEFAIQCLDIETGGDGEYRYRTDHLNWPIDHCPDAGSMKIRIKQRFNDLEARATAAEERVRVLSEHVRELSDDLGAEIEARYAGIRHYPANQRRYERDIAPVVAARATLSMKEAGE